VGFQAKPPGPYTMSDYYHDIAEAYERRSEVSTGGGGTKYKKPPTTVGTKRIGGSAWVSGAKKGCPKGCGKKCCAARKS